MVVLEVGDTLEGVTPRQQDKSSALCHSAKDSGFETVGKFADVAVVCLGLGTPPIHTGALFSVDHACDSRVLGHVTSCQRTGGIGGGNIYVFWLPCL